MGWLSRKIAGAVVFTALALGGFEAAAADEVVAESVEEERAPVLTGELSSGFFAGRPDGQETAAIAPRLQLGIRPRPAVEIGFNFGVATLHQAPVPGSDGARRRAAPGNIGFSIGLVRERRQQRYSKLNAAFGFGIPTGFAEADRERQALGYAVAMNGGFNAWEWEPATMSIVVPVVARVQVLRRLVLGADGALAGMFVSSSNSGRHGVGGQLGAQIRYVFPWFGLGVRMQGSYNSRHPVDTTQVAAAPFMDIGLCRRSAERRLQGVIEETNFDCPARLFAAAHVNIDAPYGFVGDGQQIWGGQVGLGWSVF